MKIRKTFIIISVLFLLLPITVNASDNGLSGVDISSLEDFSKKLQQNTDYIPKISFSRIIDTYKQTGSIGITLKDFAKSIGDFLMKEVILNSRLMVELLFIAILCAVLQNVQNAFSEDSVSKIGYYACYLLMVIIIVKSFVNAVEIGRQTINMMIEFTNMLIPPLIILLASVGGFTSAATLDPIVMIAIKIISDVIRDFILPMAVLTLVVNIVDNLSDSIKITKLGGLIKQVSTWALGFIMTVFIGIITVRSTASTALDQLTLKTTKFAVDNFVPVVGKCMSDAISTVASYSLVLKNAIGIAGLLIMICICLFPLIKIMLISLIYKLVGAVMEPVVDKRIVECLTSAGNVLTIVFASVLSVSVMFFIMITIIMSTGKLLVMVG